MKNLFILCVYLILLSASRSAFSATCSPISSGDVSITTDCELLRVTGGGNITVGPTTTISDDGITPYSIIFNSPTLTTSFINMGSIIAPVNGNSFLNQGNLGSFTNAGSINGDGYNLLNSRGAHINTLTNSGSIGRLGSDGNGISNWRGVIDSLINSGTITVSSARAAIYNWGGVITSFTNTGSIIVATGGYGILNVSYPGSPDTPPTLTTLNNLQGAGNTAGALAYEGILPTNYNIIINSASQYGRLAGTSVTGATAFGIYAGSLITSRIYTGVLQGLSDSNVGATRTGNYDGMDWTLAISSGTSWDLTFTGASLVGTQASLHN